MVNGSIPVDQTTYKDSSVTEGDTYDYRVKANNIGGDSNYSDILKVVVPPAPVPTAPLNLTVDLVTHDSVKLSWGDSSLETSYEIMRRDNGVGPFNQLGASLSANTVNYVDNTVDPDTFYEYKVVAVNSLDTADSNPVSLTTN